MTSRNDICADRRAREAARAYAFAACCGFEDSAVGRSEMRRAAHLHRSARRARAAI